MRMSSKKIGMLLILMLLSWVGVSWSATYTVTNNNDSGDGSLRKCVLDADASPGLDTILFGPAVSKITLTSGGISVNNDYLYIGNTDDSDEIVIDAGTMINVPTLSFLGNYVRLRNTAVIHSGVNSLNTYGLYIVGDNSGVYGCRIGTDWGNTITAGFQTGIMIAAAENSYVGTISDGNVIVDCTTAIWVTESFRTLIRGNRIGTNRSANATLQNWNGIVLDSGSVQTLIGLPVNVICTTAAQCTGIEIKGGAQQTFGNTVTAVWMNVLATTPLTPASSNFTHDILIHEGAFGNYIGVPASPGQNIIYGAMIAVSGTTTDYNGFYGNTLVAVGTATVIDLVHPGSNNGKSSPTIQTAVPGNIQGISIVTDYIQVFVSDRAVGQRGGALRHLGSTTTDLDGNWSITPTGLVGGEVVTALATDGNNNTSEFAVNVLVIPPTPTPTQTVTFTVTPTNTATRTATRSATPTRSVTETITPTITLTSTISATTTISPTHTITPTETVTPTQTMTATSIEARTIDLGGNTFIAYPNPAKDQVTFVIKNNGSGDIGIQIFNLAGERAALISVQADESSQTHAIWKCGNIAPGMYIARLVQDGKEMGKRKIAVVK